MPTRRRRILVLAQFFEREGAWISDFCSNANYEFKKAIYPAPSLAWHQRGATTPPGEWLTHVKYVREAMNWEADCVIACFPQLALVAAAFLRVTNRRSTRLIAWHFNLGGLSSKWKGQLAGAVLNRVDRFVVHARSEIENYARWMGLAPGKFLFVPLQKGAISCNKPTPIAKPYVVSMGSAQRDYATLAEAARGTGIKTVIVAKKSIVDALPDAPELIKLHGLTAEECEIILAGAEVNVVPLQPSPSAAGQVTLVTAMRMGIATIATRCVGTVDYIRNDETGVLVPLRDAASLRRAIESLWTDEVLRSQIAISARDYAEDQFSDEAAGRYLDQILREVLGAAG